jgi:TRAP-type mannitol/chloroaromatic compound transport system permease large subunit
VNLLESDLLQALPLYVLMGVLLDRLEVASAIFGTGMALMPRRFGAPLVCGLGLGAVMSPMNGSVGASVLSLAQSVSPRLAARGVAPATRHAVIAVAATFGVVIPPSLVLILLGDAMLTAHTIAANLAHRSEQIITRRTYFARHWFRPRCWCCSRCRSPCGSAGGSATTRPAKRPGFAGTGQVALASISVVLLVALLGGVTAGYFYAVEAAAIARFTLLVIGVACGQLRGAVLRRTLADVMATTGALFALLVAATTLTLVLRIYGTDRLVGEWIAALPGDDRAIAATVLAAIGVVAFVLDAFEIIFVVVPIVIPPLLVRVADAPWVAVLVLLALQTSFLLPPFGYALMMLRTALKETVPLRDVVRALAPFLVAQLAVLALVLTMPALVHLLDPPAALAADSAPLSDEEVNRRMNELLAPPEEGESK